MEPIRPMSCKALKSFVSESKWIATGNCVSVMLNCDAKLICLPSLDGSTLADVWTISSIRSWSNKQWEGKRYRRLCRCVFMLYQCSKKSIINRDESLISVPISQRSLLQRVMNLVVKPPGTDRILLYTPL